MSLQGRRKHSGASHQLRLTGSLVRMSGDKRRLCLETVDSGRFMLIGSPADELYDQESVEKVTIEGRMIRTSDSAKTSSVVEVLDYQEIP